MNIICYFQLRVICVEVISILTIEIYESINIAKISQNCFTIYHRKERTKLGFLYKNSCICIFLKKQTIITCNSVKLA